jgi:TPR repeat protein
MFKFHFKKDFASHPHHHMFLKGLAFENAKDFGSARDCYELAREGLTQHPSACAKLWEFYQFGRPGIDRNFERAYVCAKSGAQSFCIHCNGALSLHIALGWGMHRRDLSSGIEKIDVPEAVRLAKATAQGGSAYGQYALATLYFGGIGVAQSEEEAFKLYSKAADQGLGRAQLALGACFKDGMGVDKNSTKAASCLQEACDLGVLGAADLLQSNLEQNGK